MRSDAFATLYFFHPLRRLLRMRGALPILMYHSISNREERTHPYYRTVTSPEAFSQQMQYLHENGYSTVGLDDVARCLAGQPKTRPRPVVITFDDGFHDFYTHAFPVLSEYGFTATMFLPTAYIGKTTRSFKDVECLTWGEVRELQSASVKFGSDTVTHPQLRSLKDEGVQRELRESKSRPSSRSWDAQ